MHESPMPRSDLFQTLYITVFRAAKIPSGSHINNNSLNIPPGSLFNDIRLDNRPSICHHDFPNVIDNSFVVYSKSCFSFIDRSIIIFLRSLLSDLSRRISRFILHQNQGLWHRPGQGSYVDFPLKISQTRSFVVSTEKKTVPP